jgi:hypothetical protein
MRAAAWADVGRTANLFSSISSSRKAALSSSNFRIADLLAPHNTFALSSKLHTMRTALVLTHVCPLALPLKCHM